MREYAKYCLQKWAEWVAECNGYPEKSNILKFQEAPAYRAESSIPTGVEPTSREAEIAIAILAMMRASTKKSQRNADIIRVINIKREKGESVERTIERLGLGFHKVNYSDALEEFTIRLDTIIRTI